MASLVLKMSVSLDGYVAPVDGSADWAAAGRSYDALGWTVETVSNADAHLIGAVTTRDGPVLARRIRAVRQADERDPQGRVLELLASADLGETTIASETGRAVTRLKERSGGTCSPTAGHGSPGRWSRPA